MKYVLDKIVHLLRVVLLQAPYILKFNHNCKLLQSNHYFRRTIWDMESKSTPVTPNLSKKLDTPTRKLEVPRGPPPPIPPHLRPTQIPMAPIARDESFYDIASKSPSTASCYDNEYSPNSGKFKGFPYIDGAPRKRSSEGSPMKQNETDFSLLVDKSTQTQLEQEKRKSKDACAIL